MAGPVCFYVPAHIIDHIAKNARQLGIDPEPAQRTAIASQAARQTRRAAAPANLTAALTPPRPGKGDRQIFDDGHQWNTGVTLVRGEGDAAVGQANANAAYDGLGATRDFYRDVFGRDSIDNAGLTLLGNVNFGVQYDNAFWDGTQMVFGNGDDVIFTDFTKDVDVCAHELTHGVTQYTAGLEYSKQSGALNESFSDVFGVLVKQFAGRQEADEDERKWLIGAGSLMPKWGRALRSMKAPGTAWEGDQQPATMDDYVELPDDNDPRNDNGGVHINSGIPNHAFYLAATALGGYAWETAGRVWYVTLTELLGPESQFTDAAQATVEVARELFGDEVERAVTDAWSRVGVLS